MSLPIFQIKRRNKDTALENSTGGKLNGLIEGELGYNYYDNSLWIGPYNGTTSDFSILVNENHQLTNSKWTNGTTTGPQLSLYQYDSRSQKGSWLNVGAIPSASEAQSGIVTVAAQNFKGVKTFKDGLIITNAAGTSNVAKIDNSGYIEGTRLKTTSATELTSANKIAVIENGWIYYITPSNLITNISLAGSGLTQTGTTINHTNGIKEGTISGSSGEIAHGNAINIPKITYNNTGHITGVTTTSVTLPNETPLSLSTTTGTQLTPTHGGTFDVITGITKGSGNYDLNITTQAVKLPALNGAVTSIATANLTTNRALISNSAGKVAVSDISVNELNCLDGVTSNIQTQLDAKSDAKRWSCPTQVNAYSRVCKLKDYGTGILTVMYDQNSQAVVHSYMVGTSYTMAALYQIGSSGYSVYSNQIVRIVQGSSATEFIVEIQNKFGYNGATSVTAHLTYIPLTNNTTCTPYTVYTATSSSATELAIIESRYRGIVAPNFYGHATSATQAHQIIDSGDNTKQITLNYSATEISDPTYLAGWNGYELRGVKRTDLTVGKASLLEVADTRNVNETPTELVNANGRSVRVDFKQISTVGLSSGTYAAVMNIIPWSDATNWSGGKNTQLGFTDDGRISVRKGNGNGWDSWKTVAYTDDKVAGATVLYNDDTMKLYSEFSNEINFGGTSDAGIIYFGYRAKDSKPIPTKFIFGNTTGTAELVAAKFTGPLNGNAATATQLLIEMSFTPAETALTMDNVKSLIGDGGRIKRGSWSYAANGYIASGSGSGQCPFGAIDLAGTTVIQANGSGYTQIYITPPTANTQGAITGEMLYYINNGSQYNPKWYRVLTNANYSSYALPKSGGTMTGAITTVENHYMSNSQYAINMRNSDIINANAIYFGDAAESTQEGLNFYRDGSTWDTIYANNGTLYFDAGSTTSSRGNNYTVIHSGNIGSQSVNYSTSSGTTDYLRGIYTGNGGAQGPSYVGTNRVRCNMMHQFVGTDITTFGSYADVLMMNAYNWNDVPYATALAIQKTGGKPRAWIASGGNSSTWSGATELITANNISSYVWNYTTTSSSTIAATNGSVITHTTVDSYTITITDSISTNGYCHIIIPHYIHTITMPSDWTCFYSNFVTGDYTEISMLKTSNGGKQYVILTK